MPIESDIKINYFLTPFSLLYSFGVRLRNQLFDWGILPCEQFPIPLISIGNLAVGGTGKTPHAEFIIQLLRGQYRLAVLSRGYKRKTSGFVLAGEQSTSLEIGDEPFQMKKKFPEVLVAVDANRRSGIHRLLALPEGERPEVILLDDAFQHRYVMPSLSVVLTDYHRLFYSDRLLPAGQLREPYHGIHRADVVVVTKCDAELKPIDFRIIEENMKLLAHQQLFFTRIVYGELTPVFSSTTPVRKLNDLRKEDELLLVAGIASPVHFIEEARKYSDKVTPLVFSDHHTFSKHDIKRIKAVFDKMTSPNKIILVTEKDAARLLVNHYLPEEWKRVLYYLPITVSFCNDKSQTFESMIKKHIVTVQRNSILR
ncbi:MAG: tetraacyldisaccharide 4'-kinase [Tannerellaceae bacterium]